MILLLENGVHLTCSFFTLKANRDCHAVAHTWPWSSAGTMLQDQPSQEGTTPRARGEDNLVPSPRSGVMKDHSIAFGRRVSQVLQLDTRLWTVKQVSCNHRLGWTFLWVVHVSSLQKLQHLSSRPSTLLAGSCVTASATDIPIMQPPPGSPCLVMFSALGLADGEDLQIGEVTLHVNGRGCPFVQFPECLCL